MWPKVCGVNLLHVRDLKTIDCEAKARVSFLSRRCSHILCNAPKDKKRLATERIQKPKKLVVGPSKRQVLLGLVASSGSSGHVWKATTDKTNLCVRCERCSLWVQQNDKPDLFDRLIRVIRVPCLAHVLEPPLQCHVTHKLQFFGSQWKCTGCDAQLSVRVPKLSQKLKSGCKPKPKGPKEAPPFRPVSSFFQPVVHPSCFCA